MKNQKFKCLKCRKNKTKKRTYSFSEVTIKDFTGKYIGTICRACAKKANPQN